jgi:hypothetical protein
MGEHEEIAACASEVKRLLDGLESRLKGRRVRILSNYNGQPWGSSKRSLKGKVLEVERIYYDGWPSCPVTLALKGHRLFIRFNEVEFLAAEKTADATA